MSQVTDTLVPVLAGTFALYRVTHLYHWNVTGPQFPQLHGLFNDQYDALFDAIDTIAEQLRKLGTTVPYDFADKTTIDPAQSATVMWQSMVANLITDHQAVIITIRSALDAAEQANDQATLNMLAGRMDYHLKQVWMLSALLS